MPAGLPGDTVANNTTSNPTAGRAVTFDLMSGPDGSPLDRDGTTLSWDANNHPVYTAGASSNASTGLLATGIGFGPSLLIDAASPSGTSAQLSVFQQRGFSDDYTPGATRLAGTAANNGIYMYIGGGRSNAPIASSGGQDGIALANPWSFGYGIGCAGNGGARDAGAGPAFTGYQMKMVTAAAGVATGAAIESGFLNRSGVALVTGQSAFGVYSAASTAPSMLGPEDEEEPEEDQPVPVEDPQPEEPQPEEPQAAKRPRARKAA